MANKPILFAKVSNFEVKGKKGMNGFNERLDVNSQVQLKTN